jgi:hypothetical protein
MQEPREPLVGPMDVKRFLLVALAAGVLLTACGGTEPANEPGGGGDTEREDAWLALVAERELEPDNERVAVEATRAGAEVAVRITVADDAPAPLTFADGLYGAEGWAYRDGSWDRIDTADIRTLNAPILAPGEGAELRLPIEDIAEDVRVLVPVESTAAWGDAAA